MLRGSLFFVRRGVSLKSERGVERGLSSQELGESLFLPFSFLCLS